jgi:basic membrane protein A
MKGKKGYRSAVFTAIMAAVLLLPGCEGKAKAGAGTTASPEAQERKEAPAANFKIAYLTENLGDNAANDNAHNGIKRFMADSNIVIDVVETKELQDYDINARNFAQEGYNLIMFSPPKVSEIVETMADEFPDTWFIVGEGTVNGKSNVTCWQTETEEAAFLVGYFSVKMNQILGGPAKAAFVGGQRNPVLERAQYGFTAGAETAGGQCTSVYVGSFTDVAKGKEITMQLYQDGLKLAQAYAGGAGMGVYQAAESMPEGYYALGAAAGQFNLSNRIIASQVKNDDVIWYNCLKTFTQGNLENGILILGTSDGSVGIKYSPENESKVPQALKDEIKEFEKKIISGEIVPPSTEAEYRSFKK